MKEIRETWSYGFEAVDQLGCNEHDRVDVRGSLGMLGVEVKLVETELLDRWQRGECLLSCPSSEFLGQRAGPIKGGSGSSG